MSRQLRAIPAVEKLLLGLGPVDLPRAVVTAVVRRHLTALRKSQQVPDAEAILTQIRATLHSLEQARIQPVINGTGILVHTNLGRAPLGSAVIEALRSVGASYNNLEYDLATGDRGSRAAYLEHNLALLCGAEAATVVNNCAAALVLTVRHFTRTRREVLVSRGELVQIGGGFRIPEILEASGAVLREVGTTNKTSIGDYAAAIGPATALILKVHRSNFFMGGFVESPAREEIAALARNKRLPFVEDLGSGALTATEKIGGLDHEPTAAEVLRRGAGLVTFSGDKLMGGPQAGVIAGRAKQIAALKREPFYRALRCDKLILAALQTTVDQYLSGSPETSVPVLAMLQVTIEELRVRAEAIVAALQGATLQARVGAGTAQMGGGTLPQSAIPSITLDLLPEHHDFAGFATRLRNASPPVIGYISARRFKLDLRTVFPWQDESLIRALRSASQAAPER